MKNKKGFTLVEVIVSVVLIMAVMFYLLRTILVTSSKNSELVVRQEYSVYENNLLASFYDEVDKKVTSSKKIVGVQPDTNNSNIIHFSDLNDDLEIKPSTESGTADKIIFNNVVYALPANAKLVQKDGKYYSVSYVDSIYDESAMVIVDIFTNVAGKDDMIKLSYQGLSNNDSSNAQACTITFHWNNASGSTPENTVIIPVRYEDTLDLNNTDVGNYTNGALVKEEGWYTQATGGTLVDFSKPITSCSSDNKNMDVYAHWGGEGFEIEFVKNCATATGDMPNQKVAMNVEGGANPVKLEENKYVCPGHEFHGWNTVYGGTGTAYGDGAYYKAQDTGVTASEMQTIKNNGGVVKLYAQWDANTINKSNIKINMNKGKLASEHGSNISTAGDYITKNGNTIVQSIEYNNTLDIYGLLNYNNSTAINIIRTGYTVRDTTKTYYKEVDGTRTYYDQDKETYKASDFCNSSSTTCTTVLYVNWSPIKYKIYYNCPDSTSNNYANYISGYAAGSAMDGKLFKHERIWEYDKEQGLIGNHFSRTGYTFKNWKNGSTTYTNTQSVKNLTSTDGAIVTLTCQWTPNTYTVNYSCSSATSGSTASSTHTYDVAKALTANGFKKTGYTFKDWKNGSTTYANKASVKNLTTTNSGKVTLTCEWTPKTYTVKFDCNGGSGAPSSQTATYDKSFSLTSKLCTTVKKGYHQVGWTRTSNNSTWTAENTKNYIWKIDANVTLKAKWAPNTYTVKYAIGNGTSGSMTDSTFTYDKTYTLKSNTYSRSGGYVFYRWKDPKGNYWTNGYSATWTYVTPTYGITSDNKLTLTTTWLRYNECQNSACGTEDYKIYGNFLYTTSAASSTCSSSYCSSGCTYNGYKWYMTGNQGTGCTSGTANGHCCQFYRWGTRNKTCRTSGCGYVKDGSSAKIYE